MYSYRGKRHILFFGISLQGTPIKHKITLYINITRKGNIVVMFGLFNCVRFDWKKTSMTTLIKAKLKKSDDQTNSIEYREAAKITEYQNQYS